MYKKYINFIFILIGFLSYMLGFQSIINYNEIKIIWIKLLFILVIDVLIIYFHKEKNRFSFAVYLLTAFAFLSLVFDIFQEIYTVNTMASIVAILNAVLIFDCVLKKYIKSTNKIIKINLITGMIVISLIPFPFLLYVNMYEEIVTVLQKKVSGNNKFDSNEENQIVKFQDEYTLVKDIKYGNEYPNSFLDIYYSKETNDNIPTLIYIHGGAYVWGDKGLDKKIIKFPDTENNIISFLENGLNVVSINYALAPEYKYPIPIIQISQAVQFLQDNAEFYNLDMEQTFYLGWSAGGQIVGQFINIQINEQYSNEMNIKPVVNINNVFGVILNSALLDYTKFDNTNKTFTNFIYKYLGQSYIDSNNLENNMYAVQANVIDNATKDFPPTYISDGNVSSFQDQAVNFHQRLKELGVYTELNYHNINDVKLPHYYEAGDTKEAQENRLKQIDFINKFRKQQN